ncbi:hypothetical protein [Flavobacterium ammonificans]|uniref:T9SS type A sorting domain-containing protein n=1 Tax=Flavobacterium ammonificans TaxID=1751056 RepID=A0ABN6KST7_9FLAO|nr:hypothetical protein [Flavobacterium ammonificans]BDB52207.1 hypothetical protein GENT11_05190 [Flavobacterium ammonificans]
MKKLVYFVLLLVSTVVFSQSNAITYQAVIYMPGGQNAPGVNVTNVPMSNKNICLQFSFVDASNRLEYQEEVKVKTDEFGMVNITVGQGTQTGGYASNFSAITWTATAQKNLQVSLDATGLCSRFEELSNEPIASVPFANAAIVAGNVTGVVALVNGGTGATTAAGARVNLGIGNVDNTSDLNKPISTATKNYIDSQLTSSTIVDADATTKGKLQLAGDLAGTAAAPSVPGLALKENISNKSTDIVADAASTTKYPSVKVIKDYVDALNAAAGVADGSITSAKIADATIVNADVAANAQIDFTKLNIQKSNILGLGIVKGDLGLGNVDNTSDAAKPVSTATQTALNLKANAVDLAAEVTRATAAETTLTTNLGAEVTRATAAEATLTTNVTSNATAIAAEVTRATAAETTLTTNLAAEVTRATAAEATLTTNVTANATAIAAETTRATAAEATLTTNLAAEVTRATAAEALKAPLASPTFTGTVSGITQTMVGLSNVDNTSDANKPVSTATQTALDLKENLANKSTDITVDALSTDKYPSVKLIKDYVDASVSSGAPDATTVLKGKIKLAGDLTGTADLPTIATDAVTSAKIKDGEIATADIATAAITYAKIQNVAADKVLGRVSANAGVVEEIATTGTGDVVRATSPTLVTPNLGTPSAAVLTSATGLPLTTGVTGILPGANGGTGVNNGTKTITLGGNFTTSGAFATTLTATAATTVTLPTTGTLATLDGTETLTNKTLTSPSMTAPVLGAASATSINKLTITEPANNATLTIADGKTLTANNSIVLAGTDGKTMTFPSTDATIARTDADQTFTGTQTFSSTIAGSITGNAATVTTNANLTGPITSVGNATTITDAAVTDAKLDKANIPLSGFGAATADVALGGKKLTGVANPTAAQDAATKSYVDALNAAAGVADGSITSAKIANATIVNDDVSTTAAIAYSKLNLANSIVAADISASAVETAKINNAAVTEAKLAADAVTSAKIKDGEIATADIATAAITYAKIQNVAADKVLGRVSANAGVVEEIATTGTGDVVRATSPTLVTPNLGTPSAAVLTSATGLPLTTGVTGILPGANGGTGVNNGTKTITLGGNLTTSGAFATTLTATAATSVTLPTTGTLATLDGTETLTNKTLTSPTMTAPTLGVATATSINGLTPTALATGFTIAGGTASKTLTVSGDATVSGTTSGTNTGDQTITLTGDVTGSGTGSFAATIGTGKVTTATIAADAVTSAKIADGTIIVGDLADDAIETAKIKNANVTTTKLADAAVTSAKIADGTIVAADLADSAVTNAKLATGIDATKLADGSVTNTELQYIGTLTSDVQAQINALSTSGSTSTIAINAINTLADGKIYVGNASNEATEVTPSGDVTITNAGVTAIGTGKVLTAMLATDAVTTAKITNANVTEAKLSADAVTSAKIKDGEIVNADVSSTAAIAYSKLNLANSIVAADITANAVTTAKITDANVTEAKLAADAVTSAKILDSTIATIDIADAAITYAKIQNVAAGKVLGNFTGTAGAAQEIATIGTGDVVRATSPTLVTPVIGAATGTSLSVSGQLTSTVATGTAPLVVTSTTPVANLNIGGNAATVTNGIYTTSKISALAETTSAELAGKISDETGSGTLVFATSPTLVTPALGTPSAAVLTNATGLPISSGVSGLGTGVATALATPSSANLIAAVTDETGTGALVFATSPTLVTPNLGTPSAAVLTSATGLPLTSGVTGILPIANGGTGSSSQNFVDLTTAQTVAGAKTFSGNTAVSGSSTFTVGTGATALGGTLAVTGATTLNGNTSVSGSNTLTVGTGATTLGGTLGVTGATTLSSTLGVTGNATLSGTLGVTGATSLSSTLAVTGNTTLGGTLGVTGNTTIGGTTTLNGNTSVSGTNTLTVGTGATALGGALTVAGATTLNGTLTIPTGASAGEVLISDANGVASWSYSPGAVVVRNTNAAYTIGLGDSYIFYTGTGNVAFTIPAAASTNSGKEITIKNKTSSTITVNAASGTMYVDSANTAVSSFSIGIEASNNWVKLVSDGSQWNVLRALF